MEEKRKISNRYMTNDELRKWQDDQWDSSIMENISNDIVEYIANYHSSNLLQESAIDMAIQSHGLHQHNENIADSEMHLDNILESLEIIPEVAEDIIGVEDIMEQAVCVAIQVQGLNAPNNFDNQTR